VKLLTDRQTDKQTNKRRMKQPLWKRKILAYIKHGFTYANVIRSKQANVRSLIRSKMYSTLLVDLWYVPYCDLCICRPTRGFVYAPHKFCNTLRGYRVPKANSHESMERIYAVFEILTGVWRRINFFYTNAYCAYG